MKSNFPFNFYMLSMVGFFCAFSPVLFLPEKAQFESMSSLLHKSILSGSYRDCVMIELGIAIPVFAEFIMDVFKVGVVMNNGIFHRAVIFFSLWVPDIVVIFYVILRGNAHLFDCIAMPRTILICGGILGHIQEFGDDIIPSKLLGVSIILEVLLNVSRSYLFSSQSELAYVLVIIFGTGFLLSLVVSVIIWMKKYRQNYEEWTDSRYTCTVYILVLFIAATSEVIFWYLGLELSPNSTLTSLISHRLLLAFIILSLGLSHSRAIRYKVKTIMNKLEMKRIFVRLVSHEIRTPLNIVTMGLHYLETHLNEHHPSAHKAEISSVLNDSQEACEVAVNILNDFLSYEKLDAGVLVMEKTSMEIWPFIKEATKHFFVQARAKGVGIIYDSEESITSLLQQYELRGDRAKLSQVIRNIMSNAIKFTPAGGSITISASVYDPFQTSIDSSSFSASPQSPQSAVRRLSTFVMDRYHHHHGDATISIEEPLRKRLRLDFTDTGHGISKENLPRLFNEIVQFDAAKLQNGGGSGIGLWVSKKLVTMHDGGISVLSDGIGKGCTFRVELPLFSLSTDHLVIIRRSVFELQHPVAPAPLTLNLPSLFRQESKSQESKSRSQMDSGSAMGIHIELPSRLNTLHDLINHSNTDCAQEDSLNIEMVRKPSALMVDDSSMNLRMMQRTLSSLFSSITFATDGDEAVMKVKESMESSHVFDVILMDYQMARMNGPDAAQAIRALGFTGLIIGVTGNTTPADVHHFTSMGANRVLIKPIRPVDVVNLLSEQ